VTAKHLLPVPRGPITLRSTFDRFLAQVVNPPARTRERAQVSHNYVRSVLRSRAQLDRRLFNFIPNADFLTGSFDRGTKTRPLDDVDVFMVLDGARLSMSANGTVLPTWLGATAKDNPLLLPRYLDEQGCISSGKVLLVLRSALAGTYPASRIRRDGQAVNVWFESRKLGLDLVPAFYVTPANNQSDRYLIPAGSGYTHWIPTNPKRDAEIVATLDEYHRELFRPVVKLVKWWNRVRNQGRLRSYYIEVLCMRCFGAEPIPTHGAALTKFFQYAGNVIGLSLPDPTGVGGPIAPELTELQLRESMSAVARASGAAQQAMVAALFGQTTVAIARWRQVLGPKFGLPVLGIPIGGTRANV